MLWCLVVTTMMSVPSRGLRLLSLDGGGIRGMSALLILKQIMYLVQQQESLSHSPLPCEYFDLIGGTSTGGIIAIMLGRLRMSVNDAIDYYEDLSKTVFQPRRGFGNTKFDHKVLERVIKDVVKKYIGNENATMLDNRENACKTFVCARTALDMNSGHPHLFRTYMNPIDTTYDCEIWEAARATSATPNFFERIFLGGHGFPKQPYIDGGLGLNNPIRQVLEESHLIFPDQSVACIISIGTGKRSTIQIPNPNFRERTFGRYIPIDAAKATMEIATDCDATDELVNKQLRKIRCLYYRLNVDQGMQSINFADFDKVQNVVAHTDSYIKNENVREKLQEAVLALCERRAIVLTSQITGNATVPETDEVSLKLLYNIPESRRARHFVARDGLQKKLDNLFNEQQDSRKTAIVPVIGMGGAGKTQVALEYCCRKRQIDGLQTIFWIDATSLETVHSDMKNIAKCLAPLHDLTSIGGGAAMEIVNGLLSSSNVPWLIVLDNLDDPSKFHDILSLLPSCHLGAVLITSRDHEIKRLSTHHLVLQRMTEPEGFQLLLGHQPSDTELLPAKTLLDRLGWLPLAIDQAQAYMTHRPLQLETFITEFDHRKKTLLQYIPASSLWQYKRKDFNSEKEVTLSAYTTWEMSLSLLKSSEGEKFPLLENVLILLAFFHFHGIYEEFFSSSINNEELTASPMMLFKDNGSWNHFEFEDTIMKMQNLSLLQCSLHNTKTITISIHPLISDWLQMRTDKEKQMALISLGILHIQDYLQWENNIQEKFEAMSHMDTLLLHFKGDDYSPSGGSHLSMEVFRTLTLPEGLDPFHAVVLTRLKNLYLYT